MLILIQGPSSNLLILGKGGTYGAFHFRAGVSARLAREALLKSKVQFEGIDHIKALRYIYLVGGAELFSKTGLTRHMPYWKGKRSNLITVGGEVPRMDSN